MSTMVKCDCCGKCEPVNDPNFVRLVISGTVDGAGCGSSSIDVCGSCGQRRPGKFMNVHDFGDLLKKALVANTAILGAASTETRSITSGVTD